MDPFKDGADWLVEKLAGGRLEVEAGASGDVLMGVRIGRVGVVDVDVDVAAAGNDEDGLNVFAAGACTEVVDEGIPNGRPGEKASAFGLSTGAEG